MIHVARADEPPAFDRDVRQPGLDAIRELVGESPLRSRPGRKRTTVVHQRRSIPADKFPPIWREALPVMRESYNHICAYLSLHIANVTGAATIDHFVPRANDWKLVYEWSNYRLACSLVNSRKGIKRVLDPFEIQDDWFALELVAFQVIPGSTSRGELAQQIEETISTLRLNDDECCAARQEYVESYLDRGISLCYLERRAPFVARELRRQGRLRDGDR